MFASKFYNDMKAFANNDIRLIAINQGLRFIIIAEDDE